MSQLQTKLRAPDIVMDALLKDRFQRLWMRCATSQDMNDAKTAWSIVEARYSEPHRHYHDKQHLAHCLDQLDLAADIVEDPCQVEMAIWFHDLINDPGQATNEQQSADHFRRLAAGAMAPDFIDAVAELILVTTHREKPPGKDQQFICDIDLASFGCPWECFMRDSKAVKAEFTGTDEEYYRGKTTFLHAMLQRRRIFLTDFFNDLYEQQARENIQRLLELIERRED
jgi:predicted metal-dependent HD superfamily phosphohydrolase